MKTLKGVAQLVLVALAIGAFIEWVGHDDRPTYNSLEDCMLDNISLVGDFETAREDAYLTCSLEHGWVE